MISVIIPTHNRAAHLGRAIHSVVTQGPLCGELIIVDDGSTEDTAQLVARLARQSPVALRYFYQENKGAAAARNRGIREASGEILAFLDSDDAFAPDKLVNQWRAMQRSPHYLISHTREIWYRRGRLLNQKKKHRPPHGAIFPACLPMCVVGMSTVMARRELFHRYGLFDETLPCCEDYDLWLRLSCREEFLLVDLPLTVKEGGRADQLSAIHRQGMDKFRITALCNLLESGVLSAFHYQLALEELTRKCAIYGQGCRKHGREREGNHYLELPRHYQKTAPENCGRGEPPAPGLCAREAPAPGADTSME